MNKKVYVSIQDYQENEKLPGAVSTETEFAYLDNGEIGFIPMRKHVPENYGEDVENNLFVDLNGAVANAFDLKFLKAAEQPRAINEILSEYRNKYPEYEFEMKKGEFPVKVSLGMKLDSGFRTSNYSTMSTHVLYIKNFGKFVKTPKLMIRKTGGNSGKSNY